MLLFLWINRASLSEKELQPKSIFITFSLELKMLCEKIMAVQQVEKG
jgi:hypothetical protein